MSGPGVRVELSAVVLALDPVADPARPLVLTPPPPGGLAPADLPTTGFDPAKHPTLQRAIRDWVTGLTGVELGHVEQLYTFGDPQRSASGPHTVSIGYLALTAPQPGGAPGWTPWARWFPWEDRRAGPPAVIAGEILPRLRLWAGVDPRRHERIGLLFGTDGAPWREELTLERYELLYEAELVGEAWIDRGHAPPPALPPLGTPAPRDHRRILATAIGRIRAQLKYRPVLFELMGETFTLWELQRAAEAVAGVDLHKQNFRRMVERSGLIEPTGRIATRTGGRPAAEYRLAAEATWGRRAAAVRFGAARRGG